MLGCTSSCFRFSLLLSSILPPISEITFTLSLNHSLEFCVYFCFFVTICNGAFFFICYEDIFAMSPDFIVSFIFCVPMLICQITFLSSSRRNKALLEWNLICYEDIFAYVTWFQLYFFLFIFCSHGSMPDYLSAKLWKRQSFLVVLTTKCKILIWVLLISLFWW